jgi:hypothetical protein
MSSPVSQETVFKEEIRYSICVRGSRMICNRGRSLLIRSRGSHLSCNRGRSEGSHLVTLVTLRRRIW